jgi:hypothetical protein
LLKIDFWILGVGANHEPCGKRINQFDPFRFSKIFAVNHLCVGADPILTLDYAGALPA